MAPTPTARAADLLLPSRAARLDRSIPLLIAHATAASKGTASCSDRASRSLAAGCAPTAKQIFGRTSRSSPNYQSVDSSASMPRIVTIRQPSNEASLAVALPSASSLLTKARLEFSRSQHCTRSPTAASHVFVTCSSRPPRIDSPSDNAWTDGKRLDTSFTFYILIL